MNDINQQKLVYQKQMSEFEKAFSNRFTILNNYLVPKGKICYSTKVNIPNKTSNVYLNM